MPKDGDHQRVTIWGPDEGEFNSSLDPAGCLKWSENLWRFLLIPMIPFKHGGNHVFSNQLWRFLLMIPFNQSSTSPAGPHLLWLLEELIMTGGGGEPRSVYSWGRLHTKRPWFQGSMMFYVFFRGKRRFQSVKV